MYNVLNVREVDSLFMEQWVVLFVAGFLHNGIQDPGPFHLVAPPFPVAGGKSRGQMELVGAHQLLQSLIQKGHTSPLLTLHLPTQSHSTSSYKGS